MSAEVGEPLGDRFSREEGDWLARQFFSPADLRLSPEEYAARHAHLIGLFSLHRYRSRDAALGAWVSRLGEILSDVDELERCRRRFLTAAEQAEAMRQQAEGL